MSESLPIPSDFYTGLVAELYEPLRSTRFDVEPYVNFVTRSGQPALELGCGAGDPILELRARGLEVEGLDSSQDMLFRCAEAAAHRRVGVVLHHCTIESMDLGRRYKSIYLAGATFNLLPDDDTMRVALERIAAHLEPGGSALIPLFIPSPDEGGGAGTVREHLTDDSRLMRLTVVSVGRDADARVQRTHLRYELIEGERVDAVERAWLLHWIEQDHFRTMATNAGLVVRAVFAENGEKAQVDDSSFVFLLSLEE